MEDSEIMEMLDEKRQKMFVDLTAKYLAEFGNKPLRDLNEFIEERTKASEEYERETQPIYEKYKSYGDMFTAGWTGATLVSIGDALMSDCSILPFVAVAGFAVAGLTYCSLKQRKILNKQREFNVEKLALMSVKEAKINNMREKFTQSDVDRFCDMMGNLYMWDMLHEEVENRDYSISPKDSTQESSQEKGA